MEYGNVALKTPETETAASAVNEVLPLVNALDVKSPEDYSYAAQLFLRIKAAQKRVDATFDPIIDSANKSHKIAIAEKKKWKDPLNSAEATVESKMKVWSREEERLRLEEESRQRAAAEKAAREAAARRAEEEAIRREIQRKAQAEAENIAQEERLKKAVEAAEGGDSALAEAFLLSPVMMPIVELPPMDEPLPAAPIIVIPTEKPKIAGIYERKFWNFEIVTPTQIKRDFLKIDEVAIGKAVRSLGKMAEKVIGGIRVFEDISITRRSGQ